MARPRQRDLLSRLADAGEDAIQRLGEVPGTDRVMGAVTSLRDRVDEVQRRLRGLDALEKRLDALEKRVDSLTGTSSRSRSGAKTRPSTSSSSTSRSRKSTSSSAKKRSA